MIVLIVFGGFLVGTGMYFQGAVSKYATILYHYNAEYRAGNSEIENVTIQQGVPALIDIYYRNPQWNWTLELQAWAIANMSVTNTTAFNKLKEMVNRGQCELIAPIWSYQLLTAFTLDDINVSLHVTRDTLRSLGINKFTRVLFFQESQSFAGFGSKVFKDMGFDTCMIGSHTLSMHGIHPTAPLYKVRLWNDPTTEFYYLPYNWVPEPVQDGFHFWTFLATGETVLSGNDFTTQGSGQGLDKYIPVPELAIVHEEHLRKLYDSGYKLITIHDYVTGLENRGEYKMLERYVPETTWRDLPGFNINRDDSNGLFTWMGFHTSRGNATHPGNDDGDQLAETYRTSNVLKAIKTLLLANWNELAPATRDDLNASLVNAYKLLFKAEGTDPVGWEPGWITDNVLHETDYSRNHNRWARQLAWTVLQNLSVTLGLGDAIQVYTGNMSLGAGHAAFSNTTATWMNETCTPTSLSLDDLPVHLSLELDTGYGTHSAEVSNCTWGNHAYTKVDITVPETTGLRLHVGSGYPFWYSPTFYENRAIEYTLEGDEPFFLPLSNGLYFSGNETQGMAVIKNCSSRHVAFMASREFTGYFEKTSLRSPYTVKDVHYSFIMIQGSLQEALALANFVNTRPTITLDVTSG